MKTPYKFVSLIEAEAELDPSLPLFADTETIKLYGKIRLLQLYQEGMQHVLLVDYPEPLQTALFLDQFETVWHNSHYDITTIQQNSGSRWVPKRFQDTFFLSRLAMPTNAAYSLDAVMEAVLGYCPYTRQHLDKKKLQKSDWSKLRLTEDQLQYAATDVYYMPKVYEHVRHKLGDIVYDLDISSLRAALDFQWNGLPVDEDARGSTYVENQKALKHMNVPVNVNSYRQVRSYIGEEESDDLALARFAAEGNKKAEIVRAAKKLSKQNSFLDKFDSLDGRIYGKFKPSTVSGRFSSDDQNLQQLPRALKGVFGYKPEDGRVLVYADYAQLELRTICAITWCLAMEKLFREGEDLHGYTARMVFGEDWTKAHRQISKTYNFNLLYGGGISMIISILLKTTGITQTEMQTSKDRKRWRNLWPEIYGWQQKGIEDWQKGKTGSTPLGRPYKGRMMTDHLNIENQGAGAEVAKLALHYWYRDYKAKWDAHDVKLCNFIHDSYILDCPDDPEVYQPVAKDLAACMQLAWFEMSKLFKIKDLPMPVEVAVGYNWGDIESDDVANIWDFSLEPYAMLEVANAAV